MGTNNEPAARRAMPCGCGMNATPYGLVTINAVVVNGEYEMRISRPRNLVISNGREVGGPNDEPACVAKGDVWCGTCGGFINGVMV
tara:strand:- start:86 stop:343 length:258 start_codon:yes stop_codon:yes gene_type:complete